MRCSKHIAFMLVKVLNFPDLYIPEGDNVNIYSTIILVQVFRSNWQQVGIGHQSLISEFLHVYCTVINYRTM